VSDSSITTFGGVILGAVLGFLASIGYSWWQRKSSDAGLRARLKAELEHIQAKLLKRWDDNNRTAEAYFIEFYQNHRSELMVIVSAEAWESIIRAYQAIDSLRISQGSVQSVDHYKEVLDYIDIAIKNL